MSHITKNAMKNLKLLQHRGAEKESGEPITLSGRAKATALQGIADKLRLLDRTFKQISQQITYEVLDHGSISPDPFLNLTKKFEQTASSAVGQINKRRLPLDIWTTLLTYANQLLKDTKDDDLHGLADGLTYKERLPMETIKLGLVSSVESIISALNTNQAQTVDTIITDEIAKLKRPQRTTPHGHP